MPKFDALTQYGRPNVAWDQDPARQMKGVGTGSSDANIVDTPLAPEEGGIDIAPKNIALADPWEKYAPQTPEPEDPWAKYNPQETVTDFGDTTGRDLRGMTTQELQQEPWYSRTWTAMKEAYGGMKSFDDKEVAKFKDLMGDVGNNTYMLLGTARALDIAVTTAELAFRGAQTGAYEALSGVLPDKLAKDIVSMPDAFAGSPYHFQVGKVRTAGGVSDITDVRRAADLAKPKQFSIEAFIKSEGRAPTAVDIAAAKFPDASHPYPQPKAYEAVTGNPIAALVRADKAIAASPYAEFGTVGNLKRALEQNDVFRASEKGVKAQTWLDEFLASESGSLNIFGRFVKTEPEPVRQPTTNAELPPQLAGAKPRYNYGEKAFVPKFASDVDRAMYITAQKTPSKMDAAYRSWLHDQGYTDAEITQHGKAIRDHIKSRAAIEEAGDLEVTRQSPEPGPAAVPDRVRVHTDHEAKLMIGNLPVNNLSPGLAFGASELGQAVLGKEFKNSMTGTQLYEAVAKKIGPESASQLFVEHGVYGIKVEEGHYIFDNRLVEPINIAGQPVMPAEAVPRPDPGLKANPIRKATDDTGNIRLDRINASEDALSVMREAAIENEGHTAARAGEASPHAIAAAAEMTGLPANELANHGLFNNDAVLRSVMGSMIHSATDWAKRGREFVAKNDFDSLKAVVEGRLRHGYIQEVLTGKLAEAGRTLAVPKEFYNAAGELMSQAPLELPKNARQTLETLKKDKEKAALDATKANQEAVEAERAIKDATDKDAARKAATVAKRKARTAEEDAKAFEKEHEALAKDIERRQPPGGLKEFRDTVKTEAELEAWLKKHTGETLDDLKREAKAVSEMTPDEVTKFATKKERIPRTTGERLYEGARSIYYNWLLSGTFSHVRNILSSELLMQIDNITPIAAGTWSHLRKVFGATDNERVFVGEAFVRWWASNVSVGEALQAAGWAIKNDAYVTLPSQAKFDKAGQPLGIAPKDNPLLAEAKLSGNKAVIATAIVATVPVRLLRGIDSYFAIRAYRAEVNAWAYKAAVKDGFRPWDGKPFFERVAEHADNPYSKSMKGATDAAEAAALRVNYMTPLGPSGEAFSNLVTRLPFGFIIAPFTHVPVNVVKTAMEMTPGLNVLGPVQRANLLGHNGPIAQSNAMGRVAIGSAIGFMGVKMALDGQITGDGPAPGPARVEWLLNHKPRSIQLGGEWRSYANFGTLSTVLGIAVSLAEAGKIALAAQGEKDADEAQKLWNATAVKGVMMIGSVIDDMGLQTFGDLMRAITDPTEYTIGKVVRNEAASVVPFTSFLGQAAAVSDPYQRRVDTWLDAMKNKVPGQRETLLPRLDRLGRIVPNPRYGIGHSIFAGVPVNPDPLILELQRLDIAPTPVPRHIDGVQMTPAEQNEAQATFGATVEELLTPLVNAPGWRDTPDVARKEVIRSLLRQSREQATMIMKMKYPAKFINKPVQNQIDLIDGTKKPSAFYERPE